MGADMLKKTHNISPGCITGWNCRPGGVRHHSQTRTKQ